MKKRNNLFVFLAASLLVIGSCASKKATERGKNVVTKEFRISDYSKIELVAGGKLEFDYEQKRSSPYLSVTTDRDIFEKMEIRVSGDKLIIRPKEQNARLSPTVFKVTGNSRRLKKVSLTGGGTFYVNSNLSTDDLELNITGSGVMRLDQKVSAEDVETKIAGSGAIHFGNLRAKEIESSIAGSGFVKLSGEVREGSFKIAGSGIIEAFDCPCRSAETQIGGSGQIEVTATRSLDARISGSGTIRYKGNPADISRSTSGSGNIRKVN